MTSRPRPVALTVAGTDSGGGAGVTADLKTFEAHGVWGACAVAAVTAQGPTGVRAVHPVPAAHVRAQIDSVVADIGVDAVKTGMLADADVVLVVAAALRAAAVPRLVVDPVLVSSSGQRLLEPDALGPLRDELLPMATVVTPNLAEAAALLGGGPIRDRSEMTEAALALGALGPQVVLVTGGHLDGDPWDCAASTGEVTWFEGRRVGADAHGSGCVLAAALTAELARGMEPLDACIAAKRFTEKAIAAAVFGSADPGWANRI